MFIEINSIYNSRYEERDESYKARITQLLRQITINTMN